MIRTKNTPKMKCVRPQQNWSLSDEEQTKLFNKIYSDLDILTKKNNGKIYTRGKQKAKDSQ